MLCLYRLDLKQQRAPETMKPILVHNAQMIHISRGKTGCSYRVLPNAVDIVDVLPATGAL